MPNPLISVVIPSYNRKDLLKDMMQALSSQTMPAEQFEVIVVLDGSTDGSKQMLNMMRVPFSLRAIYQENSGVSVARNNGARAARGEFVVFLDDDILPAPELLEEHIRTQLSNHSGVVLGLLVGAGEGKRGGWNIWEERVVAKHYKAMSEGRRPAAGRRLYSGNFSVHREFFLNAGGFNESLRRGEDVELGFRLERDGVPFYFNPKASVVHRGFRKFSAWCHTAYLYGQTDVQLAVNRGHGQVMCEIFGWYRNKPQAVHLAVNLTLGRKRLRSAMVQALRLGAGTLSFLRLNNLAHFGYSLIFGVQYWNGVADELGSKEVFQVYSERIVKAAAPTGVR